VKNYETSGGLTLITELITEGRDYGIPCIYDIKGYEKIVCIIIHGFSSSKESVTAKTMLKELPLHGIGAIAFDLPAHGESEVNGDYLLLSNCVNDLAAVEARARKLAPEAEIVYFASSFGAYISLIYLASKKNGRQRAFLRSAAVNMPRLLNERLTPESKASLNETGEFTIRKEEFGYIRDIKLTQRLYDELACNDVFTFWHEGIAELCMIHGESDDTVPLIDAQSFATKFDVPLTVVPNGDHQLSIPGTLEKIQELAIAFFLKEA